MAERREIQFTIDDDGEVSIRVVGVKGVACERLTREIEQALGVVASREHTSEYYQDAPAHEKVATDGDGDA